MNHNIFWYWSTYKKKTAKIVNVFFLFQQILGKSLRVDHVKDYKPPKDSDKYDSETRLIHTEGCAPKEQLPPTEIKREPPEAQIFDGVRLPMRLPIDDIKREKNVKKVCIIHQSTLWNFVQNHWNDWKTFYAFQEKKDKKERSEHKKHKKEKKSKKDKKNKKDKKYHWRTRWIIGLNARSKIKKVTENTAHYCECKSLALFYLYKLK